MVLKLRQLYHVFVIVGELVVVLKNNVPDYTQIGVIRAFVGETANIFLRQYNTAENLEWDYYPDRMVIRDIVQLRPVPSTPQYLVGSLIRYRNQEMFLQTIVGYEDGWIYGVMNFEEIRESEIDIISAEPNYNIPPWVGEKRRRLMIGGDYLSWESPVRAPPVDDYGVIVGDMAGDDVLPMEAPLVAAVRHEMVNMIQQPPNENWLIPSIVQSTAAAIAGAGAVIPGGGWALLALTAAGAVVYGYYSSMVNAEETLGAAEAADAAYDSVRAEMMGSECWVYVISPGDRMLTPKWWRGMIVDMVQHTVETRDVTNDLNYYEFTVNYRVADGTPFTVQVKNIPNLWIEETTPKGIRPHVYTTDRLMYDKFDNPIVFAPEPPTSPPQIVPQAVEGHSAPTWRFVLVDEYAPGLIITHHSGFLSINVRSDFVIEFNPDAESRRRLQTNDFVNANKSSWDYFYTSPQDIWTQIYDWLSERKTELVLQLASAASAFMVIQMLKTFATRDLRVLPMGIWQAICTWWPFGYLRVPTTPQTTTSAVNEMIGQTDLFLQYEANDEPLRELQWTMVAASKPWLKQMWEKYIGYNWTYNEVRDTMYAASEWVATRITFDIGGVDAGYKTFGVIGILVLLLWFMSSKPTQEPSLLGQFFNIVTNSNKFMDMATDAETIQSAVQQLSETARAIVSGVVDDAYEMTGGDATWIYLPALAAISFVLYNFNK